ncbi:MAG: hypothetical protein H6686_06350 [Fibrobacteria bacterium]|nr:hypothetical protein [Fibrobacteria bacterium]
MVRAHLAFRKPWQDVNWRHAGAVPEASLAPLASIDTRVDRPYLSATAPDIISRIQRLKMGADINQNGLYFFNGFRPTSTGGESQPLPWWNNAGPQFPGAPGESWTLYEALEQALTRHFGEAWRNDPSLQIDLVAHSQGGITIREMLANASGTNPNTGLAMPVGVTNAANHIRRVVTVNSPHFGSVMPTDRASIPSDFNSSVGRMIDDWENFDRELLDATVDLTFLGALGASIGQMYYWKSSFLKIGYDAFIENPIEQGDYEAMRFGVQSAPVWGAMAFTADALEAISRLPADIRLRTTGNWLWPQSTLATWEYPWGSEKIDRFDHDFNMGYSFIDRSRRAGAHLAINSEEIRTLLENYPTLPDGRELDFLPLYSTTEGMGDLIRDLAVKNLGDYCDLSQDLRNAACYGGFEALRLNGVSMHYFLDRVDADLPLGGFLDDFTNGWLAKSDMLVQEESQRATREGTTWKSNLHPGKFQEPRTYEVRRFLTGGKMPDAMAPHGPISSIFEKSFAGLRLSANIDLVGAPWLGHDIYCALAPECQDLLSSATGHVVRLSWESEVKPAATLPAGPLDGLVLEAAGVTATGDFRYGVMPVEPEPLAMAIVAEGATTPALVVSWSDEGGVAIQSGAQIQTLIPPGFVAVPRLERQGDVVTVRARSWSGREYVKTYSLPLLGASPEVQVLRVAGSSSKPLLVGEGSIPQKYLDPRPDLQAEAWLREARGTETAWSRPRIAVQNTGRSPLHGLTFKYLFRADPNHPPVLDATVPELWRIENRAGDVYELVFSDPQVELAPGELWPLGDAARVGLHMTNWAPWDAYKDPSNDRNYGQPRPNEWIQVWDGSGHLLWGRDPEIADPDRPVVRKVFVASREAAVGESNMTKPEIEIRNDGNIPLQDLQATWWLRLPVDAQPILEDWYTPTADVRLEPFPNGLWAIRMRIHDWIQPGQKLSVGSFGVHLPLGAPWNRALSPSREGVDGRWVPNPWIEVRDAQGNVLWGNVRDLGADLPPDDDDDDDDEPGHPLDLPVEWRDEAPWETNLVKPRVRVTNPGTTTVRGFALEFPVVPERNLVPVMVLDPHWAPGCHGRVETRPTETVGILECPEASLEPGTVWPHPDGAVFSLHYSDWSVWDRSNDPAFEGLGSTFTPAPGVRILGPGTP